MVKNDIFETQYERFLRERAEKVVSEYFKYKQEILSGELSPNRVIQHLAKQFSMSGQGIKTILQRKGIYKSAKQPIITPLCEYNLLSTSLVDGAITTHS